jgi:hypothetical protein
MTINIQKCSNVTVIGHHSGRNCKAVYNITTGQFYASVLDTARILEVSHGAVSFALSPDHKRTCKGMRLCFVSRIMENLDEIKEANDIRAKKSAEDEAASTEYAKLRKAQEDYKNHKHNAEEFRRMMEEELRLAEDANRILRGEC